MENIVILRLGWCLKRWVSSLFFESQAREKASAVTDCWIFFALNSDLPQIYLYMLMPQFNLSDLPGGHCVAKWGLSWGVTDTRWKHCRQIFIQIPQQRLVRDEDAKENKWANKSCRHCLRMGLFLVEVGMQALVCVLLSSLFLWHTYDLLSNSFWLIR